MNKKVKYFSFAIAIVAVASIMIVAIYAATTASAGISANVSWTATEGVTFELEAWVVNNASHNGIGNTTVPKAITKQIVTTATTNQTAGNIIGELNCGFYDGTNDGVNNPSDIIYTYKIKNTGSNPLKVTATKTPKDQNESGTTAENHKPEVALSSKLDSADNTVFCISSIIEGGFGIAPGKTLEYIITLSMDNPDLSITSFDAGVTFNFGIFSAGTPTIYVDGVAQTGYAVEGAITVGDYLDALDGSQYPGYFYDEDLTIYAGENDIVTNDTKLYTKTATLDYLTFTNGDGTCSVGGKTQTASIVIPRVSPSGDLVTRIDNNGFRDGAEITSIIMPSSVTSIGSSAFSGCTSLTSITIPDSVTSIGSRAFFGCNKLTSIYIPSSVTTISGASSSISPFYNCSSSLKIYCGASSKPSGWGTYWNYYGSTSDYILSVTWGVTREQYNSQYA